MNIRLLSFALGAIAAAAFALPQTASASLVYDASIVTSAQGFGNAPRDLTLQANGQDTTESGSVGVSPTGTITFGTAILDSAVYSGNGLANLDGLSALPLPRADNQKYGIPTIGSLGISFASQIGVLFNATEPGGDSVNVTDVTLKFYTSGGTFLGAIDGQQNFESSVPGNGVAGFAFVIDAAQQPFVNGLLAQGGSGTTLALEATIEDFGSGPETFLIFNTGIINGGGGGGTSVPEPTTVALLGLGLLGFAASRRKSAARKHA